MGIDADFDKGRSEQEPGDRTELLQEIRETATTDIVTYVTERRAHGEQLPFGFAESAVFTVMQILDEVDQWAQSAGKVSRVVTLEANPTVRAFGFQGLNDSATGNVQTGHEIGVSKLIEHLLPVGQFVPPRPRLSDLQNKPIKPESVNDGKQFDFPTKVPGVAFRCFYPKDTQTPIRSLVVSPKK